MSKIDWNELTRKFLNPPQTFNDGQSLKQYLFLIKALKEKVKELEAEGKHAVIDDDF